MKILVLNAGSSSLKYKLFENDTPLGGGVIERIGEEGGVPNHHEALETAEKRLVRDALLESFGELDAVGHRVVHGGERFVEPVRVDDEVIGAIRTLIPLAPLHNPANLAGIETMAKRLPGVPQVAVFDTAFHQTMPEEAFLYAIPRHYYLDRGVRRYGFHGTSHHYVAKEAAATLGRPLGCLKLVTLHLGNGASLCAIEKGRSVETSMGFTPLAGLVMGTRSGDLDPEVAIMMERETGEADTILNRRSGLLGLCGENDMRRIETRVEKGDEEARRALAVYVHRIRHYLGAYLLHLGGADALVFTGGVGEHSVLVRERVCQGLEFFGIALDGEKNRNGAREIAADSSRVRLLVIPTDEELEIARETRRVLRG